MHTVHNIREECNSFHLDSLSGYNLETFYWLKVEEAFSTQCGC